MLGVGSGGENEAVGVDRAEDGACARLGVADVKRVTGFFGRGFS